ncbi:MAG: GIY-YIG nuclease family protein [Nitrospirae bacterium]|nr:GIY-YIG nuclease family protein [Nitrospirota bacterium]
MSSLRLKRRTAQVLIRSCSHVSSSVSRPENKEWCVYVLLCRDTHLYTGITNDIRRRLKEHEKGVGSRFVRSHLPFKLVWTTPCRSGREARSLECRIKRLPRKKKMEFLGLAVRQLK